jgi:hypothetical protein
VRERRAPVELAVAFRVNAEPRRDRVLFEVRIAFADHADARPAPRHAALVDHPDLHLADAAKLP